MIRFLLLAGIGWTDRHPALMLVGVAVSALLGAYVLRVMV